MVHAAITHAGRLVMAAVMFAVCCFSLQVHAVQVDENEEVSIGYQTPTSPLKSELALQKGFRRRTWTGPAWLDNVTSTGHVSLPATHYNLLLLCCFWSTQQVHSLCAQHLSRQEEAIFCLSSTWKCIPPS